VNLIKKTIRKKITRPAKQKAQRATSVKCGTCGKRYTNPITHVCTVKTDFRQRRAAGQRRQKREAAKARRKAAADRRKAAAADRRSKSRAAPAPRPAQQKHDYRRCQDSDCTRHACVAFREGFETGVENCPLTHA
jgi:hypothetical protein